MLLPHSLHNLKGSQNKVGFSFLYVKAFGILHGLEETLVSSTLIFSKNSMMGCCLPFDQEDKKLFVLHQVNNFFPLMTD